MYGGRIDEILDHVRISLNILMYWENKLMEEGSNS